MKFNMLPFHIGPSANPHNPCGLPDTYLFSWDFSPENGTLSQHATSDLLDVLDRAYQAGQLFGTPLADDSFGRPYAEDFLAFIAKNANMTSGKALEIGAGVGYLTRRLCDAGWQAIGIEPGKGYAQHWERYGVDIINEFFPCERTAGPYDLICGYGLLEHIAKPIPFLLEIRKVLSDAGVVILSVPDCTEEITAGDPAILLHEHFTYFNAESLAAVLELAGFTAVVQKSAYGRCLYAVAYKRFSSTDSDPISRTDLPMLESYPTRVEIFMAKIRERLTQLVESGSVGIYCPARALAILEPTMPMRFFDDDSGWQNKYIPPFEARIENRNALLSKPVDSLVIMSRTFGERIRNSLRGSGYSSYILTVREIR